MSVRFYVGVEDGVGVEGRVVEGLVEVCGLDAAETTARWLIVEVCTRWRDFELIGVDVERLVLEMEETAFGGDRHVLACGEVVVQDTGGHASGEVEHNEARATGVREVSFVGASMETNVIEERVGTGCVTHWIDAGNSVGGDVDDD